MNREESKKNQLKAFAFTRAVGAEGAGTRGQQSGPHRNEHNANSLFCVRGHAFERGNTTVWAARAGRGPGGVDGQGGWRGGDGLVLK